MRRHLSAAFVLISLATPLGAEPLAADCDTLRAAVDTFVGYDLMAPPSGPQDGWCVLDGAALRSNVPGQPDLTADRLRLRGSVDGAALVGFEVDLTGLSASFKAGDDGVDDRLRGLLRLQSADLRFAASVDSATGVLSLSGGQFRMTGGTEVTFAATGKATGLSSADLLAGRLTMLELGWRNDGRLLRPVMEMLGERLVDGAKGDQAVDAARLALRQRVESLPATALVEDSAEELGQWLSALPQGRGKFALSVMLPEGIGAAQLLVAGMQDDPTGPEALAKLLSGAAVTASWTPGMAP
jgi:hypothetical protein